MNKKAQLRLIVSAVVALATPNADACTRIFYKASTDKAANFYIVGRTMDWAEDPGTNLWAFPQGMARDGGVGAGSIKWTSKYGSVIAAFHDIATADGMNDAGLVANVLYLVEANYQTEGASGKPQLSVGAWAQYALDNYSTVAEAVEALKAEPFAIIAPPLPGGKAAGGHLALSDASGDNAIFEYVNGKLVIHHDRTYTVLTNSPTFDEQLAIDTYWKDVGGVKFLPGTHRSSDRFARMSWNLGAAPMAHNPRLAVATVFSLIRSISVPLGIADPEKPNIAATIWRSVSDIQSKRYYFESSYSPSIFWVDLEKLNLARGSQSSKLDLSSKPILAGEVSDKFVPTEPFEFLHPPVLP
ncbi:MAG TPA: linear amide C-N hydrolase [Isosphaeraceae bacterium]|nr:linear amide C-N hydrolase [Isosphaeraceae bacterium]